MLLRSESSWNDINGNEDVGNEGRFSYCGASIGSRITAAAASRTRLADGTGHFVGVFEVSD